MKSSDRGTPRESPGSRGGCGPRSVPIREVDRADFDPSYDPDEPILCEICGNEMRYTAVCKIECPVCGYRRDCSDP